MKTSPSVVMLLVEILAWSAVASCATAAMDLAAGVANTVPVFLRSSRLSQFMTSTAALTRITTHGKDMENSCLLARLCALVAAASSAQSGTSSTQTRRSTETSITTLCLVLFLFWNVGSLHHAPCARIVLPSHHSQYQQASNVLTEGSTLRLNGWNSRKCARGPTQQKDSERASQRLSRKPLACLKLKQRIQSLNMIQDETAKATRASHYMLIEESLRSGRKY